jgi:hypothetical protein
MRCCWLKLSILQALALYANELDLAAQELLRLRLLMVRAGAGPPGADALNLILEDGLPVLSLSHPAIPANQKNILLRATTAERRQFYTREQPCVHA